MRLIRIVAMAASCALATAACARAQKGSNEPGSILKGAGDSVHVRLLDAVTAKALANADVELWSDNGIRCVKAPCPTDGKQWKGTSDASGRVTIPKASLNTTANIKPGHSTATSLAMRRTTRRVAGTSICFSEECPDLCPHPIKLLDARTHDPIVNRSVLIEIRGATVHNVASVTSNALGYVMVPFIIVAKGADSSWVVVEGYRDAKLDFAATRRKLRLQPL